MAVTYQNGTKMPLVLKAPFKKVGNPLGGSHRPSEGKMFPRGTGTKPTK